MQVSIIRRVRMSFTENEQVELAGICEIALRQLGKDGGQFEEAQKRLAHQILGVMRAEEDRRRGP